MQFSGLKYHNPAAAETPVLVAAGPRGISALDAYNGAGAADAYVQLFDADSADTVVLGETVPTWVVCVPASGGNASTWPSPLPFANGLVVAVTDSPAGSSAPAATIVLSILHL